MITLTIPRDVLQFIIAKARAYDAEVPPVDEDSGSNATDDGEVDVLEATADNPTRDELTAAIETLNRDEQIELLALMWLGRGDFTADEWLGALRLANQRRNPREAEYLVSTPLLADYLEEGLSQLGYSLEDIAGVETRAPSRRETA